MNSLVCLAVLCSVLAAIQATVQQNGLIGDLRITFENGFPEEYCLEFGTNERWAINKKTIKDCLKCECSGANGGILCTGLGYKDGILPPAGCTKRKLQDFEMQNGETCCYQMVNEDNQAEVCGEKVCA